MCPFALQLIHPCDEQKQPTLRYNSEGTLLCGWNQVHQDHSKKYVEVPGHYIADKSLSCKRSGSLRFWADWEGISQVTTTGFPRARNMESPPSLIHKPIVYPCKRDSDLVGELPHNTDPLVFSELGSPASFLYSNCKQNRAISNPLINRIVFNRNAFSHRTKTLAKYSLVIFGCINSKGTAFNVDCVFVVDSYQKFRNKVGTALQKNLVEHPGFFDNVVTEPLNFSYQSAPPLFSLYRGRTYANKQRMFSFFPCKIATTANNCSCGSISPALSIPNNALDSLYFTTRSPKTRGSRHFVYPVLRQGYTTWQAWNEIVRYTINQGFSLGIAAYL